MSNNINWFQYDQNLVPITDEMIAKWFKLNATNGEETIKPKKATIEELLEWLDLNGDDAYKTLEKVKLTPDESLLKYADDAVSRFPDAEILGDLKSPRLVADESLLKYADDAALRYPDAEVLGNLKLVADESLLRYADDAALRYPDAEILGELKPPRLIADESLYKYASQNPIDDMWLNTNAEVLGDLNTSKSHLLKAKAGRGVRALEDFVNTKIAASGGNFNAAVSANALKKSAPSLIASGLVMYDLGQEMYNEFANGGNRLTAGQLNTRPATIDYVTNLKTSDLANLDLDTIVDYAYNFGLINDGDKESLSRVKKRLDQYEYTRSHSAHEGDSNVLKYAWGSIKEFFNELGTDTKSDKEDADLIKRLSQTVDLMNSMNLDITPELLTSEGGAYYVPLPDSYTSAMINPNDYKVDVNPVKRYTNQELADLYNINYSVDDYYDLLKQGTEAAVDYGKFVNEQNLNTVLASDTQEQNAYLDSIRNTKAESIINGATLGARMANELLDNVAANQAYSTKVANANAQAIQNMQQYYDDDARAMVDARAYHDTTLAPKLSNVLESLYYDDIQRYNGEVNTNADLYMNVANANANAIINNAAIQSAYNNLVAKRDAELNYLFEFIEANKNPLNSSGKKYNNKEATIEGIRDYTNYLSGLYSNGNMNSYYDYLMN